MNGRISKMWIIKSCAVVLALALSIPLALPVAAASAQADTSVAGTEAQSSGGMDPASSKKIEVSNPDFETTFSCGLDGYVAYDFPTQVNLTIKSAKDFTGTLRLVPNTEPDYWMANVAYEREITLAKDEPKKFTFYPSSLGENGRVRLAIYDEEGKEIYAETDKAEFYYMGESLMIGILSDDYSALNYMDGVEIEYTNFSGTTRLAELTEDSFPENYLALSTLNYLVIDNYDTAKLSAAQYNALKEWVENGGVLILGLGANYQNVLHIFADDFVSGSLGSLGKGSVTWQRPLSIQDGSSDPYGQSDEEATEDDQSDGELTEDGQSDGELTEDGQEPEGETIVLDDVDLMEFELKDAQEFSEFSGNQTAYLKETGLGMVLALSYSLSMEPVVSFSGNQDIMASLMEATITYGALLHTLNQNMSMYSSSGSLVADINDTTKRPSVPVMAGILLVYIILVGPGLYLILKKINKREVIWLAVPAVALVFTLVIFGFTYMYQIGNPIVNTFSVMEVEDDIQNESVYASIVCPGATEYELLLQEDYANLNYDKYQSSYSSFMGQQNPRGFDFIYRETDEGKKIVLDNDTVFHKTALCMSRQNENQTGMLDLDIHCFMDGFEGTVTNRTMFDLENVVVYFDRRYYRAGDIKKGGSVTFTRDQTQVLFQYGNFHIDDYTDKDKYLKARIDTMMEEQYVMEGDSTGGAWAFVPDYQARLCQGEDTVQNGCGAIFQRFEGTYEDVSGIYYSDISQFIAEVEQGSFDTDNMMNDEVVDITYELGDSGQITRLINQNFMKRSDDDEKTADWLRSFGEVYAYNLKTGEYDPVFIDSAILEGGELEKYLDGGTLRLRYQTEYVYQAVIPMIAASGE